MCPGAFFFAPRATAISAICIMASVSFIILRGFPQKIHLPRRPFLAGRQSPQSSLPPPSPFSRPAPIPAKNFTSPVAIFSQEADPCKKLYIPPPSFFAPRRSVPPALYFHQKPAAQIHPLRKFRRPPRELLRTPLLCRFRQCQTVRFRLCRRQTRSPVRSHLVPYIRSCSLLYISSNCCMMELCSISVTSLPVSTEMPLPSSA